MTCVGDELKPPTYKIFIKKYKCICTNFRLKIGSCDILDFYIVIKVSTTYTKYKSWNKSPFTTYIDPYKNGYGSHLRPLLCDNNEWNVQTKWNWESKKSKP